MQVAVLDDQDRVHLQDVVLGHNLDTDVQIVSGLKPTDKVVGNPSLGLLDGQQVKIVQPVPGYQPGRGSTPRPIAAGTPVGADILARRRRGAAQPTAAMEPAATGASTTAGTEPAARSKEESKPGAGPCGDGVYFWTAPREASLAAEPSLRRSWRP